METMSDLPQFLRLIAALIFVLGLMGGLALIMKKLGFSQAPAVAQSKKRLKIIEAMPLDARRRLVLLQRDAVQHLVILGPNSETLVETGIEAVDNSDDV